MPVETGPTLYLPHSQKYAHGYLAYWLEEFQAHFVDHHVQLPLAKGDAVFFNPALFHAAGTNHTDRRPPHGQPAPGVVGLRPGDGDRRPRPVARGDLPRAARRSRRRDAAGPTSSTPSPRAPRATPSRPTSTATPAVDGLTPASQADHVLEALSSRLSPEELAARLDAVAEAKRSH